jgi:hypothetical protein
MKKWLLIIIILGIAGAIVAYKYLNKPNRTVASEKGLELTAGQLVKEYQQNENNANAKYLDKAIQVTGSINEINKNQEGLTTVMLASDDPMAGVFCTLKDSPGNLSPGSTVTIKGFCSGMLTDVRLREAVIVK